MEGGSGGLIVRWVKWRKGGFGICLWLALIFWVSV